MGSISHKRYTLQYFSDEEGKSCSAFEEININREGETPSSRIRYGDTVFTQLNLSTRDNLSIKRIAAPRIREDSTLYKVLINGEASSNRIGDDDDDNVDILFDYTDKFRTCKWYILNIYIKYFIPY